MRSELDSWAFCAYKIGGRSELKGNWFPPSSDGAGRSDSAKNGVPDGDTILGSAGSFTRHELTAASCRVVSFLFFSFRFVSCGAVPIPRLQVSRCLPELFHPRENGRTLRAAVPWPWSLVEC